jgi:hypothetical protein
MMASKLYTLLNKTFENSFDLTCLVDESTYGYKGEDILYSLGSPLPYSVTFSEFSEFIWED